MNSIFVTLNNFFIINNHNFEWLNFLFFLLDDVLTIKIYTLIILFLQI